MRTIEISDNQAELLDELSARDNVPPDRLVTTALAAYFSKKGLDPARAIAGLWADRHEDGVAYQRRLRDDGPE